MEEKDFQVRRCLAQIEQIDDEITNVDEDEGLRLRIRRRLARFRQARTDENPLGVVLVVGQHALHNPVDDHRQLREAERDRWQRTLLHHRRPVDGGREIDLAEGLQENLQRGQKEPEETLIVLIVDRLLKDGPVPKQLHVEIEHRFGRLLLVDECQTAEGLEQLRPGQRV